MEIDTGINKKTQLDKVTNNAIGDAAAKEGRGKDYFKVKNMLDTTLDLDEQIDTAPDITPDQLEELIQKVTGRNSTGSSGTRHYLNAKQRETYAKKYGLTLKQLDKLIQILEKGTPTQMVDVLKAMGIAKEEDMGEATGASSSGSYSGPLFGKMENESDDKANKVKKIKNSDLEYSIRESLRKNLLEDEEEEIESEEEELGEETKVRRSDRDRLRRRPYSAQAKFRAGLNEEEEMDEETGAGSSGAYSQPAIWAKNNKNWRAVSDKNFPKLGGPGGTYVKVKDKCKKFPYCNQGDINALEFYEADELVESIERVSKRIGKPKSYIAKVIMETMDNSNLGKKLKDTANKRATKSAKKNKKTRITKEELEEIITRSFYKSPVTDPKAGIVGVTKMDLPIGKMFSMSGNKPKYE